MSSVNFEKMKEVLENGKKFIVKKVAPFALAATVVLSAGTMTAEAANVEFPNTEITYDGDTAYAKETDYKSSYVTDREAKKIYETMNNIDTSYNEVYTVMANGGMYTTHTGSRENSMARMLASINEIENQYESTINAMDNTPKQVLKKYLTNKSEEAKLIFANIVGISVKDLNNFGKDHSCVFANSIGQSSLVNVGIYQLKNNQIVSSNIVSFNDATLSNDKTLIKMPQLDVTYRTNSSTPTFRTTYTGSVIYKSNAEVCRQAIAEIDALYDKIEKAIKDGNYTKKSSQNADDIYTSIYGDTNYINQSILSKYVSYTSITPTLNQYMNYCQSNMVAKVYNKNSNSMNYYNYINYANNNTSMRVSEENGFIYYKVNNANLYPIKDRGYLKTSELNASGTIVTPNQLTPIQITVSTGVNLYVDGQLYIPTDVNGNVVTPFVYNGTTYLPARAVSNLYGASIAWDGSTNSVKLTATTNVEEGEYYIDENGNKIPFNQSFPTIPSTNAQPNTQLTSKVISASKGAKIYFNENLFTPTDVNGNVVDVLVVNGTTYLPARAVTTLFNTDIRWDATTCSVVINRGGYSNNNQPSYDNGEYYYDENGNKIPVNGGGTTNPNTNNGSSSQAYYIDPVTGEKVYIDEDEYNHTR